MWLGSGLTDPDISLAATLALYGAFGLHEAGGAERSAVSDRRRAGRTAGD